MTQTTPSIKGINQFSHKDIAITLDKVLEDVELKEGHYNPSIAISSYLMAALNFPIFYAATITNIHTSHHEVQVKGESIHKFYFTQREVNSYHKNLIELMTGARKEESFGVFGLSGIKQKELRDYKTIANMFRWNNTLEGFNYWLKLASTLDKIKTNKS